MERGKLMGQFALMLCQELNQCRLTYDVIKSRSFTPEQKLAMARIYWYFESVKNVRRCEGYSDFFDGLRWICFRHASPNGTMYNEIAQNFIIERNVGKQFHHWIESFFKRHPR